MNTFVANLRNNVRLKKLLYIAICVILGLYVFSLPSFSGRAKFNLVSYGLMAILIASVIVYMFLYKKFIFDRKIIIPFVFVLDAFICTMIYTPANWRDWFSVLFMALTFVVIFYSCKCIENQRLILKIVLFAFLAFGFYFAIIPEYRTKLLHFSISMDNRLGWYFDNVNLIGSYFATGFGLSLYLGLTNKNKRELLYILLALSFIYLGLFTGSRAFIFSIAVLFIAILYIKLRNRKFIFFILLTAFVILLVLLVAFVKPLRIQFEKTIYTLFGIGNPDPKNIDTSSIERVLWMRYGFSMGSKNIIIGLGCKGFSAHSGVGTYTHNNYADVLCNFGIPGFLIFHFMLLYPFILHFINKKEEASITIPFVFYFLVKSMFSVFYYYKDFYLIMGICYFMVDDVSFSDLKDRIALKLKKETTETISI